MLKKIQYGIFCIDFLRICKEFETIRDKAIKKPETTKDMTELIDYIDYAKTKGIEELNIKIMVSF